MDPMKRAEPADGGTEVPTDDDSDDDSDDGDDGDGDEPSAELPAQRAALISARAAADVLAILAQADGLRRLVELAERNRDDTDPPAGMTGSR